MMTSDERWADLAEHAHKPTPAELDDLFRPDPLFALAKTIAAGPNAIPDWQLDDLATALEPADMLRMCTPGGYPMFAHEDVQYVAKKQAR